MEHHILTYQFVLQLYYGLVNNLENVRSSTVQRPSILSNLPLYPLPLYKCTSLVAQKKTWLKTGRIDINVWSTEYATMNPGHLNINKLCPTANSRSDLPLWLNDMELMIHWNTNNMDHISPSYANALPVPVDLVGKPMALSLTYQVLFAQTVTKAAENITEALNDSNWDDMKHNLPSLPKPVVQSTLHLGSEIKVILPIQYVLPNARVDFIVELLETRWAESLQSCSGKALEHLVHGALKGRYFISNNREKQSYLMGMSEQCMVMSAQICSLQVLGKNVKSRPERTNGWYHCPDPGAH